MQGVGWSKKENCHMPYLFGPNGAVVGVGTISPAAVV